ncbi:hypothetical protein FOA52_012006 [Chlamydomonas sp. UWO 241]|nr:hypothetical protein FOA52_012006 [Chlamydomonas sp. UWO 241]
MAARDDTPAAQLPPTAHAAGLAATPLPAHPGLKGKRKGAKGRAKAPKDGDELVGARVFMPGREFYEAGLRPRHVVGSILGHDDVHKGCMVVRIAGERKRYFFPMGSLRAWAAAAAAAGSDDEQPGFEYAYEDGVVVEQPPLPMREGSGGALGEPALQPGDGEGVHEVEEGEVASGSNADRDAHMDVDGAAEAAVGGNEEGAPHQAADAAGSSPQPSSSGRRAAAAAAVAAARRQVRPPPGGGGYTGIPLVSGPRSGGGACGGAPPATAAAAAAAAAVHATRALASPPLGGGSPGSPGSSVIPLVSVVRGADGAGCGTPPAAVVAAAVAGAVAAVAARRQGSPTLGDVPHTRAPGDGALTQGAAGAGAWRAASPVAPHAHAGPPSLVRLWQRQKQQEQQQQQQQQGSEREEEEEGAGPSFAAGAKRPLPSTEDDGEEQAGMHDTQPRPKRARTLSEAAAQAVAVATAAPQHASAPTTANVAPRATSTPQQSGAKSGSPGGGVGSVGVGVGGRGGARKVAAGGRPKKRRGRSQRELLSDIVGKGVDIPGGVFGHDIPGYFYPARVVGPDKTHPGCVTVSLLDGSRARYYFPVPEVRGWVSGMHTRLGLDWQEEHDTVDEESVAFAARVLVDMAAGALGGGGHGIGGRVTRTTSLMQTTVESEGEGEEAAEAAGAAADADADAASGNATLLMMAAAAEDGGGDATVPADQLALAAKPTTDAGGGVGAGIERTGGAAAGARAPLRAAEPAGASGGEELLHSGSGGLDNRGGGGGERSASVSHVSCSVEERGRGGAHATGGGRVPCGGRMDCDRSDSGWSDGDSDGIDCADRMDFKNSCKRGSDGEGVYGGLCGGGTGFGEGVGSGSSQVVVGTPSHVSASPATSGDGGDCGAHRHPGCAESPDADTPTGVMLMRPTHASPPRAPLSGAVKAAVAARSGGLSAALGQQMQQTQPYRIHNA